MKKSLIGFSTILIWLMTGACAEVENAEGARVGLIMKSARYGISNGRVTNAWDITEAMLGVTKIELENEFDDDDHSGSRVSHDGDDDDSADDDAFELEIKGNFKVNLLDGTSTPPIPEVDVPPGVYNEVKLDLSPILDGGYSVILKANYTDDNGIEHPVELMLDQQFEIKIESHKGFDVDIQKLNQVLLLFELEKWFAGIDLAGLEDNDGVIRISFEDHAATAGQVKINIDTHCKSGSDDNDDGSIDDD